MSTRLCAAQARQRHPTSGLRIMCTRLLVALVAIVGAPLAAAQACTQGNTIVDGVGGRIDVADYENDLSCSWTLTCSGGAPTLSFDTFDTEANFDFVYLYEGTDAGGALLESLHGVGHAPMSYSASGSNSLYLVFETDYSVTRAGFTATFTCETGSGQSTCPETPYTLDNFGVINIQDYVDNLDCSWTLTCAVGVPTLSFDTFDTEANFDFIYVYEGDSPGGDALVDGLSGVGHAPMTYSSDTESTLYFRFTTDYSVTRAGFLATFMCPEQLSASDQTVPESSCTQGNTITNVGGVHMSDYVNNLDCSWTLACAVGVPTLSFDTFDTEANFDFIYVYEGDSPGGNALVDGLSGVGHAPMTYSTDASSSLYLRFTTDYSVTRAGFRATFTCPMGNFFRTNTCGTWETTRAECQASGGNLAVITSAAKNTAVVT